MAMQRDSYHHGDLRQALINAALELVTDQDVRSLSLREVARRVGVSHTAPYRHFADKDALLATVAEEGFETLSCSLQAGTQQQTDDPLKQLEAAGVAYVRYAIEHPSHYRVMFGAYEVNKQTYLSLADASKQALMVLVNVIVEGQKAGVVRSGEPRQLAQAAWALVHGLAMLLIDGRLSVTEEQTLNSLSSFITRMLIEGLAKSDS